MHILLYIKFGKILSICSSDIERKFFWRKSRAITLVTNLRKMMCKNPNVDLVNMNAYIKFGKILSICPQDNERKRNFIVNQGS